MSWNTILFETRGHTACITLNRPGQLNAVSIEMMKELGEAHARVESDDAAEGPAAFIEKREPVWKGQ